MSPNQKTQPPDLAHFLAIPWCAKHLTEPGVRTWFPSASRVYHSDGEDELFSKTLNTPETFPAFITLYREPSEFGTRVDELRALVTVDHGVQGWPGVCHGGTVMTILDEVLGLVPSLNKKWGAFKSAGVMTGYMNTQFLRPVPCPSTILVTATIKKIEGRKIYMGGTIENEHGTVLARADSLFILARARI